MLKFLIIMTLVIYLIYKVVQFLFKVFILGATGQDTYRRQQYQRQQQNHRTTPRDGNVSIDFTPKDQSKKGQTDGYRGGEYVDYEEVK